MILRCRLPRDYLFTGWECWCPPTRDGLRFCSEHNADHRNPSPLLLASFLKQLTAGGPTASASMHAALTWFMSSLGANIPVAHWLVKPFKFHAAAHSGRQAPELEPWELANLLMIFEGGQRDSPNHPCFGCDGGGWMCAMGAHSKDEVCSESYCLGRDEMLPGEG